MSRFALQETWKEQGNEPFGCLASPRTLSADNYHVMGLRLHAVHGVFATEAK